jgi:hypothetical protein
MSKFSLQPEDGTVQNGDMRGDDSTDLQVARSSSEQVASGYASVLVGGYGNTASGSYSAAFGANNISSGLGSLAIGYYTQALGDYTLSGGVQSYAMAQASVALGGECVAQAVQSTLLFAVNGLTESTAVGSVGQGFDVQTYLPLQFAFAAGNFTTRGDAQFSQYLAKGTAFNQTGAQPFVLVIGKGTTVPIVISGSNRSWSVNIDFQMVCTDAGSAAGLTTGQVYKVQKSFFFKVVGGTTSISGVDSFNEQSDANMAGASLTVSAGALNSMALVATTPVASNVSDFRAIAHVKMTEIAW